MTLKLEGERAHTREHVMLPRVPRKAGSTSFEHGLELRPCMDEALVTRGGICLNPGETGIVEHAMCDSTAVRSPLLNIDAQRTAIHAGRNDGEIAAMTHRKRNGRFPHLLFLRLQKWTPPLREREVVSGVFME